MNNFVVYAYCRTDGTFYYVGKGKPERPFVWRGKRGINPPKDRSRVLILHHGLLEEVAFEYEKQLILFYGRKDLGTGLLKNKTDGGEGTSGYSHTEETKSVLRARTKEAHLKDLNEEGKSKKSVKAAQVMNRTKHSERDEYGRSLAGKKSNFAKQSRPLRVTNLKTGETLDFANSVEAGLALGLQSRPLRKVAAGERRKHKGHTAVYLPDSSLY
jgi:hypothetical protein